MQKKNLQGIQENGGRVGTPAARVDDTGSGHGCFGPTIITQGSPDVVINGKPAARVGDPLEQHGCGVCPPHERTITTGSSNVIINGKSATMIGGNIDCGGSILTGSDNVIIGNIGLHGPYRACLEAAKQSIASLVLIPHESYIVPEAYQWLRPTDFSSAALAQVKQDNSEENTEKQAVPVLTSIRAHAQLQRMATELAEATFIALLVPIFGGEVPAKAYRQLYRNLSDKTLQAPAIEVNEGLIKGRYAAYNNTDQHIYVAQQLVLDAMADDSEDARYHRLLYAALFEEYGHHVDWLLRNRYSHVGGDAKFDEGAVFRDSPEITSRYHALLGRAV